LTEPVAGAVGYDLLVVTAANRAQARGYEAELAGRERAGRLEGIREWRVVPDPGDRRVGSGGSTLNILSGLAKEERLSRGHVLIVHSGGDSRRLPSYAAQGKIFLPLPMEDDRGRCST
jgi:fucokinase / fucose-1-phosphate guanylyltransferase